MLRTIGLNAVKVSSRSIRSTSIRTLTTSTIRLNNASNNTTTGFTPDTPEEKPMRIDRDLPDPRVNRKKQLLGFIGFSIAIGSALAIIFNYEKTENPIISDTLYQLRKSPSTSEWLGENIEFDGLIPWVYGQLNPVAGKINIKFYIKGNKNQSGVVRLVADRENRYDEFLIHEWSLTVNGKVIDLLSESSQKTLTST